MDKPSLLFPLQMAGAHLLHLARMVGAAGLFALGVTVVLGLLSDTLYLGLALALREPVDWTQFWVLQQAVLGTAPASFCITFVARYIATR